MSPQQPSSLGEYIRVMRERRGMSARQLAAKAGVTHSYLSLIERGNRPKPSADVVQRLADALDVEAMRLLRLIGVKSQAPALPSPRVYFRRKFGVSAQEADVLAELIEDFQRNKHKGDHHDHTN